MMHEDSIELDSKLSTKLAQKIHSVLAKRKTRYIDAQSALHMLLIEYIEHLQEQDIISEPKLVTRLIRDNEVYEVKTTLDIIKLQ